MNYEVKTANYCKTYTKVILTVNLRKLTGEGAAFLGRSRTRSALFALVCSGYKTNKHFQPKSPCTRQSNQKKR